MLQFLTSPRLVIFVNLPKLRDGVTWNAFKTMLSNQGMSVMPILSDSLGVPSTFSALRDSISEALSKEDSGSDIASIFRQKFMVRWQLIVTNLNVDRGR